MNKRHYEHTLPNIRGSLSNTYKDMPCLICLQTFTLKRIRASSVAPTAPEQDISTSEK